MEDKTEIKMGQAEDKAQVPYRPSLENLIKALYAIAQSANADGQARIDAIKLLVDRGWYRS